MKKNLKKYSFVLFFIVLAVAGSIFAITAQDNAGKIEIQKTATKIFKNNQDNLVYGRHAKVELNVKAHPYNNNVTTYDKLDVVLVLDSSGSMGDDNKLTDLKAAARDLVNTLMTDGTNQVGVVEFGTNVKRTHKLTTNKNDVNRFINRMSADGGTNIQQAIESANTILKDGKRNDAQQIVIILTDGVPTFFNYNGTRYGTGSSNDSVCVEGGFFGCSKKMKPSEAAKTELDKLKSDNKTSDVYTIVFGDDKDARDTLAEINPEQEKPLYKNYNALSGDQLKEMFKSIIEESVGRIGNDSVVTDTIPKEFKLTSASKTKLENAGVEVIENSDGSTTLKWTIGNIDADIDYKLSYEVKAVNSYHGSMYTNEGATLNTKVSENNPYYDKTNLTLEFDKPAVEIPAITKDDHYNHNSSYVGYSESVINGTTILKNDLDKNILEDIHVGNTSTEVKDEIVIVTDDNTMKNNDGTYSIYKDGVLQGILDMNEDGTFSFVSEEGISGEISFDYVIKSSVNQNHETSFVISNTSKVTLNILEREKIDISGVKTWNDSNNQDGIRPDKIKVNLYANGKLVKSLEVTSDNNWEYTFSGLYKYEKGHDKDSKYEIEYTVREESVNGYDASYDGYDITNKHVTAVTSVSGNKTWKDNNDQDGFRPDEIVVNLYADGVKVDSKKVTSNSNWSYSFTNLDKYKDGKEIKYTVKEETVSNYDTSYDGYNITNTHEIEKININGTKTWIDNDDEDGLRPNEIVVNLYADGVKVDSKKVTSNSNWSYNFTNLDKYKDGKKIKYTVKEDTVNNYDASYDGYNITNTHEVKYVTVKGTKTWKDDDNKYGRPSSVTISLYADKIFVKSVKVTSDDNWSYIFDNLPMYKDGKKINYTIKEDKVLDYDTSYDGYNVINTYNPETISISGNKTWKDNNDQDGIRPDKIKVNLYANGKYVKSLEVTKNNNWSYTFTDLVKYANGEEIEYTVSEDNVDGYTSSVKNLNITNEHVPEVVSKTVEKVWNDDNNRDGIRPDKITVILNADGEKVKEVELSADNGFKYTFNNLPKYKNKGVLIKYTVKEVSVKGYDSSINSEGNKFVITNTHEIEKNNLVINKTWNDNNNQDGLRPNFIEVTITGKVSGDVVYSDTVTITKDNGWRYEFSNLPKYSDGKEITYTVSENDILDSDGKVIYKASEPSYNDNVVTLVNTHDIIKTEVNGKKVWVDSDDKDGLRPDKITVNLYADGVKVDSKEVNASSKGDNSNEWLYSFTDLDKFKDGKEIKYTVKEEAVNNYETAYDGNIIVNTHNPKDVTVSGTKTWEDGDNKYGRPDSITINLTGKAGDDVVIEKTTKASESTNWTYSFEGLPEYSKGILINYTVSEDAVKDYDTSYNGYDITNTYNPETIDINGVKNWDDNDNQDGVRPDDITVVLYDHLGNEVSSTIASVDTNWEYSFKDLPKYANGKEIKYVVKEVSVDGYESIVKDYNITNKHVPETISYNVTKVWNDNNNQDGIRPDSIKVTIVGKTESKGEVYRNSVNISSSNNWTYVFKDLPKYRDGGIAINYSIVEDAVKGYTTSVSPNMETSKDTKKISSTITNTHNVEKKDIKITKTWKDNNSKNRPDQIAVKLLKNGDFFKEIYLTKDMNWLYVISNLDKYQNGEEIKYTIEEIGVKGYITSYDGYNIINTLKDKPKKIVSSTETEIIPPTTGVQDDGISLIEGIIIGLLGVSTIAVPVRLVKEF